MVSLSAYNFIFFDTDEELEQRMDRTPNLDREIVSQIMEILTVNPYAQTLKMLKDLPTLDNYRITLNASVELDQRTYNKPTASQVGAVWVEGNGDQTSYKRSIQVYDRNNDCIRVQCYEGCYDPLAYPLFFPHGEVGWHDKILRAGEDINSIGDRNDPEAEEDEGTGSRRRKTVSAREYYAYKIQQREGERNVILLGGRLYQQFIDDMYIKIESRRLEFQRHNQKLIRAELYQGIHDMVAAGEVRASWVGKRVVLAASFIGGPRDMQRRYLDAMALVQRYRKPDIFLTMTCNPEWDEITDELFPGQTTQDRPDLTARVFRAKLQDLKELIKKGFFGEVVASVYVIEFQKRGLPHAHFLIILGRGSKITNPEQYDKFVCAEIPDEKKYPDLHGLVVKHMIHGPCGALRPNSPCMREGKCRFRYPKEFNETTVQGEDSYPVYRRRDNGRKVHVRGYDLDNRWVAPYNPKLLMHFNCHINVEICSSVKAMKYMYKYIYKGHDCTEVNIGTPNEEINEIKMYQDARWISPPEAAWRIFSFNLSETKPSVRALQLHLPEQQIVYFNESDNLEEVQQRDKIKRTMLTEFFEANKKYPEARKYLYREFPEHFTWNATNKKWTIRKGKLEVGRIVYAAPTDPERYYLRILLNHVKGPTSFDDLMVVDGVKHPSFRASAEARGLIEKDDTHSTCLSEAATFQFPPALRSLFATMLVFYEVINTRELWDNHYEELSQDDTGR